MPTTRRVWRCPVCGSGWQIPANAAAPKRCPNCPKLADARIQELPKPVVDTSAPDVRWVPTRRPLEFHQKFWRYAGIGWGSFFFLVMALELAGFAYLAATGNVEEIDARPINFVISPLVLTVAFVLYLFPTHVALYCRHKHVLAIFIVNGFFGWTVVGWIASMVWAAIGVKPPWATE